MKKNNLTYGLFSVCMISAFSPVSNAWAADTTDVVKTIVSEPDRCARPGAISNGNIVMTLPAEFILISRIFG